MTSPAVLRGTMPGKVRSMSAEIERVRVRRDHLMLFPIKAGEVCHNIKLDWLSALWLYEQDFLSFDPRTEKNLDDA